MNKFPPDAIKRFISLVDQAFSDERKDTLLGAKMFSESDYKAPHQKIADLLVRTSGGIPGIYLFFSRVTFQIYSILDHCDHRYFRLFCYLLDPLRGANFIADFDEIEAWINAICISIVRCEVEDDHTGTEGAYSRAQIVASAYRRLSERGHTYDFSPFKISLSTNAYKNICAEIENLVIEIGGRTVVDNVCQILFRLGRVYQGLFLYGRTTSLTPSFKEANVPWNYLFNLGLKHSNQPKTVTKSNEQFEKLINLTRDFGASFDVEDYYVFGLSGISPYMFDHVLFDNVIYDELFSFQQWNADNNELMLSLWIDSLSSVGLTLPLAKNEEWMQLIKRLLWAAKPFLLSRAHRIEFASLKVDLGKENKMLEALCAPSGTINASYSGPQDTRERNAPFWPMIKSSDAEFYLQPKGMLARAIYERLSFMLRGTGQKSIENKIGKSVEILVHKILSNSGNQPSITGGKYSIVKGTRREIDLVIETDTHIFLIECKSKSLTNLSRAGMIPDALVDLVKGFLLPLWQLTEHEIILTKKQIITFIDGKTLKLNDRKIEKIVLTMLDFGSFQNRMFTSRIVQSIISVSFGSDDVNTHVRLSELNEIIQKITQNFSVLSELSGQEFGRFVQNYTFGVWWLSVDQLMTLVNPNIPLWDALKPIRHMVFGTGDIMNEYANAKKAGL